MESVVASLALESITSLTKMAFWVASSGSISKYVFFRIFD